MSVLSVPNTFVPASTILSGQVNANFAAVVTWAGTQPGLTIGAGSIGSAGITGKWPDQVLNIGTIVANNFASWRAAVTAIGTATHLWALSDPTGTIAVDAIGFSNGTYVGGPTLGAPLLRQNGVGLSGTGQYVTFPSIELPASAPWSIECYAAYTGASSGYALSSSELQIVESTASAITTTAAVGGSSYASPTLSFNPGNTLGNIAVDNSGLIYSNGVSVVRRSTQFGTVASTVTLSSPTGYSNGGIAVDASGNMYIADNNVAAAYKYSSTGTLLVTYTTGAACNGVSVDTSGLVYTIDSSGNVRRFANAGGAPTLSITPTTPCVSLGVDTSGNMYVHSNSVANVYKYGPTGTLLNTFPVLFATTTAGNFSIPIDAAGNFWIAYSSGTSYGIAKYSPTGTLLVNVPLVSATLARGLAVDFGSNIYLNHNNPGVLIEKYNPTATTTTLAYAFNASVQPNHHIITYDGTTMRYVLNGVMVGSSVAALVTNPAANLVVGALSFPVGNAPFQGVLSNIVVYSSALTGAQISSLYNAI